MSEHYDIWWDYESFALTIILPSWLATELMTKTSNCRFTCMFSAFQNALLFTFAIVERILIITSAESIPIKCQGVDTETCTCFPKKLHPNTQADCFMLKLSFSNRVLLSSKSYKFGSFDGSTISDWILLKELTMDVE